MKPKHTSAIRKVLVVIFLFFIISVVYSYYRRSGKQAQRLGNETLLNSDVARATEKIEFSENRGGKEIFKVIAHRHLEKTRGKNLLEKVNAYNFGSDGTRKDTIQSDYCEYDQTRNNVLFSGNVVVRINDRLEIFTSSLSYDKPKEIATTPDKFTLKDANLDGSGQGLTYNFSTKGFVVDKDAYFITKLNTSSGRDRTIMRSASAAYSQSSRNLKLYGDVDISQATSNLKSSSSQIYFSPDNKLDHVEAAGNAYYSMKAESGINELRGDLITIRFTDTSSGISNIEAHNNSSFDFKNSSEQTRLTSQQISIRFVEKQPGYVEAFHHVILQSVNGENKLELVGERLSADFKKEGSSLNRLTMQSNAKLRSMEGNPGQNELTGDLIEIVFQDSKEGLREVSAAGDVVWKFATQATANAAQAPQIRTLKARTVRTAYQVDGKNPQQVVARDDCLLDIPPDPKSTRLERKIITATQFDASFFANSNNIDKFYAEKNVKIRVEPADKDAQVSVSESDSLKADFDRSGHMNTAEQVGNFSYEDGKRKATSKRAFQEATTGLIHLIGSPVVWNDTTRTLAQTIIIDKAKSLMLGNGQVKTIHSGGSSNSLTTPFRTDNQAPILINSDNLEVNDKEGKAIYRGHPRASQEGSFVQADRLEIFNKTQEFLAFNNVHSVFYLKEDEENQSEPRPPSPTTIKSNKMTFFQKTNMARYENNVSIVFKDTYLRAEQTDLFLDREANRIEKAFFENGVYFKQPDREGRGTHAEFYSDENKTILIGDLAEVDSKTKGRSIGKRLTFYNNGDRIFIDNQ